MAYSVVDILLDRLPAYVLGMNAAEVPVAAIMRGVKTFGRWIAVSKDTHISVSAHMFSGPVKPDRSITERNTAEGPDQAPLAVVIAMRYKPLLKGATRRPRSAAAGRIAVIPPSQIMPAAPSSSQDCLVAILDRA